MDNGGQNETVTLKYPGHQEFGPQPGQPYAAYIAYMPYMTPVQLDTSPVHAMDQKNTVLIMIYDLIVM